jgi:DNA primase
MCFGCGAEGDVLDFIMRRGRVSLGEALEIAGSGKPPGEEPRSAATGRSDRSSEAAAIWAASLPVEGTPAERYLRGRALRGTIPASIRFANLPLGQRGLVPALVASVSTLSGQVLGIQRTFLAPDGSTKATLPGGKNKLSLGRVKGGAIRLGAAGPELIITEGLEDGLSLHQETQMPVWVAAGASMLPGLLLPPAVRTVVIAADGDPAGEAAANSAADIFVTQGRRVKIIRPAAPHKDFNDELRAVRR